LLLPLLLAEPCCWAPPWLGLLCPLLDDSLPLSPSLPDAGLLLEEGLLLDGELLLELLEDELLLLDELLEDEEELELGVDGGVGVDGVCGVVGLLALGQPLNSRQAQTGSASVASQFFCTLFDPISPDYFLCVHWFPTFEAGAESRFAQFAH